MNNRSVNKGVIYNTIKTVMGIIYPLITFPYVSRVLMTVNVGRINFSNSIVSYFSLIASLGISTYAVRECSKVRDNKEELEKTVGQIFSINILSTLLAYAALAVTFVFARPLDNYRLLICIQSATLLFTTLGADWLNTAMEDFKFIAIRTIAMQAVSLLLLFIFVHNPDDYIIYAIISVVASSGANIVNIYYRRRFCKTRFTLKIDWKKHLPPILCFFLIILIQTIFVNSDLTMLGILKDDAEVGLYSCAVKIYTLVNTMVGAINIVIIPQCSIAFEKKDYSRVNELVKYSGRSIMFLLIPAVLGIVCFSEEIVLVVSGEAYLKASSALRILSAAILFSQMGGLVSNLVLIPSGQENKCFLSTIIAALLNLVLNSILIPEWGLNAAAFTTFLSQMIGFLLLLPYTDKRVSCFSFIKKIGPICIASSGILICNFILRIFIKNPYGLLFSSMGISIVFYIIMMCLFQDKVFIGYLLDIRRLFHHDNS